jgi:hypothetical protein
MQRLAKVRAKSEARESHFMLLGVWKSVREWTRTFLSELSLWELKSQWIFEFSKVIARVKTHWIKKFLISLENSWNADV